MSDLFLVYTDNYLVDGMFGEKSRSLVFEENGEPKKRPQYQASKLGHLNLPHDEFIENDGGNKLYDADDMEPKCVSARQGSPRLLHSGRLDTFFIYRIFFTQSSSPALYLCVTALKPEIASHGYGSQ